MKVKIYAPDEALAKLIQGWIDERDYYDSPIGCRSLDLGEVCPGVPEWATRQVAHEEPLYVRCGFTRNEQGDGAWVRSSGSWAATDRGYGYLMVSGPRHSVRELLPDWFREQVSSWVYQETREPDLRPWETTT